MYTCAPCACRLLQRSDEGAGSPGIAVRGGCVWGAEKALSECVKVNEVLSECVLLTWAVGKGMSRANALDLWEIGQPFTHTSQAGSVVLEK